MKKLIFVVLALIIVISLSLTLTSCEMSKAKYESIVAASLERIEDQSKPVRDELKKLSTQKKKTQDQKRQELEKKQVQILEQEKNYLASTNPPDDFFVGHSDLVEFLELLIEVKKPQPSTASNKTGTQASAKDIKALTAATNAFSKIARELPFLEYELSEAFSELLNEFQNQTFRPQPRAGEDTKRR